jgi:hypothetical protein
VVADPALARRLDELRAALARLHREVRVTETSMDLQAEFRGVPLCRVVPYRELLHVHVGESPEWETRVRHASEFPPVMDHVVRAFLRAFAR